MSRLTTRFKCFPVLVLVALLCAPIIGESKERERVGQEIATLAMSLMERALAVGVPSKFPEHLKKKVPPHVVIDYEAGRYVDPGEGFFDPALIRDRDRGLYRELRKFWRTTPSRLLLAVPYLGESYFREDGNLQDMVLTLLIQIQDYCFDAKNAELVVGQMLLVILEETSEREDRLEVLSALTGFLSFPATIEDYHRLLVLAERWGNDDCELRGELARMLQVSSVKSPPKSVHEFLLEVAVHDACEESRAWAIRLSQVRELGRSRMLPVYLSILDDELCGSARVAKQVIKAVAIWGKYPEAVPALIRALSACEPSVRGDAVIGLEKTVGLDSPGAPQEFDTLLEYENPKAGPEELRALGQAVTAWKQWWAQHGEAFVRDSVRQPTAAKVEEAASRAR